jgi:hypothetical protein
MNNNYTYRPLFGHVFLTIQKFFTTFRGARPNYDGEESPIIVLMGTPSAAFRVINNPNSNIGSGNPGSFNGQANLPLLNFIAIDFRRIFGMENPYARITNHRSRSTSSLDGRERIEVFPSPQTWTINFQCSLWTNGYKERDDLISKILTTFRHEVGLKWYHDPVDDPGSFVWVILRMDESFTDDTNMEELAEKDSRKLVRTSFTFNCMISLPYDISEYTTIKKIQVSELNLEENRLNSHLVWQQLEEDGLIVFSKQKLFEIPLGF